MKYFIIILSTCNNAKILNGLNGKFSEHAYPSQKNTLKDCNKVSSGEKTTIILFLLDITKIKLFSSFNGLCMGFLIFIR